MDVVLLFPGQGSQCPGMGKDLAAAYAAAAAVFDRADAVLGFPLSRLCFDGPADALTSTENAQPALLAHGAAVWAVLDDRVRPHVRAAAGHSLGEFSAHLAAGTVALDDALRLVRCRGELMFQSGERRPGAMAAILGPLTMPIEQICETASVHGLVVAANFNGPGQVVISGEAAGVDRAVTIATESGAKRAVRLNVSGAFHSPLMEFARAGLAEALRRATFADPRFPVYANVNARPVTTAAAARSTLLEQLVSPVQWSAEVSALAAAYPDALYLELGPGSVLAGLVKKIAPTIRVLPCGTPAHVEAVLERVAA